MQGEASDHLSSLYRDNKRTLGDASYEALVEATDRCVVVFKLLQAIAGFVWPDRVSYYASYVKEYAEMAESFREVMSRRTATSGNVDSVVGDGI